ncbi:unnamed protein product, partial [Ectocarpus sp. 12 AP-2014]
TAVYQYTVTNAGNVRLANVTITDATVILSCDDMPESSEPGQSAACSGLSVLNWAAIEAGELTTVSRVHSVDATLGIPVASQTKASIDLPPPPSIQLDMVGTFADDSADGMQGLADVGEMISYVFTITNNGHAVLEGITLADGGTIAGIPSTTTCGDTAIASRNASSITLGGTLAVRAVITCTSSYAITEDDVNALEVSSAASVTASDVSGN